MSVKRKKKDIGTDVSSETDELEPQGQGESESEEPTEEQRSEADGEADSSTASAGGREVPVPGGSAEGLDASDEAARNLAVRVLELEGELADVKDQLLRKAADFDNFRKRMARDKEESVRFANTALLLDLLDVIDGLERAIASSETSRDFGALHQGVALIERQLLDSLDRKWGLKRMSARGKPFDPAAHHAMTVGEPADGGEQVVLEEYQSGYLLHDRVVRPAKVKVSAPRRSAAGASAVVDAPEPGRAGGAPEAGVAGSEGASSGVSGESGKRQ